MALVNCTECNAQISDKAKVCPKCGAEQNVKQEINNVFQVEQKKGEAEIMLFSNSFGTVTEKRIIINYKSGTEDIPVGQISSISLQHRRNYFFSISGFLVSVFVILFMLANIGRIPGVAVLIMVVIAIVGVLSGFANWIGHHDIVISTSGQNRKPLKVEMAKTKEGRQFVDAAKKIIFK